MRCRWGDGQGKLRWGDEMIAGLIWLARFGIKYMSEGIPVHRCVMTAAMWVYIHTHLSLLFPNMTLLQVLQTACSFEVSWITFFPIETRGLSQYYSGFQSNFCSAFGVCVLIWDFYCNFVTCLQSALCVFPSQQFAEAVVQIQIQIQRYKHAEEKSQHLWSGGETQGFFLFNHYQRLEYQQAFGCAKIPFLSNFFKLLSQFEGAVLSFPVLFWSSARMCPPVPH